MQRYYGVDFDRVIDGTVSVRQAAALVAGLPLGSATLASVDRRLGWTREDMLLLAVANSLRTEPIDPFGEQERGMAMEHDEMAAYLARPRVDVWREV